MELETWTAPPGDVIPNHPTFDVLIYRGANASRDTLAEHGWGGAWVNGVFDFHHFHSTSHEVLAVIAGDALIELGGPQGEVFTVNAGDVLVLPAGTGHRRRSASPDFRVVGAYPPGQEDYDVLRAADDAARTRIDQLGAPQSDPVGGDGVSRWASQA